jgi:hypothetical protein
MDNSSYENWPNGGKPPHSKAQASLRTPKSIFIVAGCRQAA